MHALILGMEKGLIGGSGLALSVMFGPRPFGQLVNPSPDNPAYSAYEIDCRFPAFSARFSQCASRYHPLPFVAKGNDRMMNTFEFFEACKCLSNVQWSHFFGFQFRHG